MNSDVDSRDRIERLELALRAFMSCIDVTGGLQDDDCPVIDPEWLDLGDAYLLACKTLGVEPKYEQ
jgi:hypothetical protein